jgi:hypothetical protein
LAYLLLPRFLKDETKQLLLKERITKNHASLMKDTGIEILCNSDGAQLEPVMRLSCQ